MTVSQMTRVSVFKGSREKERAYWRRSGSSYRGITLEVERHLRLCQEGKWERCPSPHYGLKAQHERRHAGRNRARVEKDPGHWRGGRGLWVPKKTQADATPRKLWEAVHVFEPENSTIRAELQKDQSGNLCRKNEETSENSHQARSRKSLEPARKTASL